MAGNSIVPGNFFEIRHGIDNAMGQDWIALIKEVEPVFLINPVNLVPEVRGFQARVRDLRAERDEGNGRDTRSFLRST